jgi:hypothetical protein
MWKLTNSLFPALNLSISHSHGDLRTDLFSRVWVMVKELPACRQINIYCGLSNIQVQTKHFASLNTNIEYMHTYIWQQAFEADCIGTVQEVIR